ncbi:MAG: hypothetical protein OXG72_02610, partial [Acidobacteria bacterium]|nr:hypothetical protein [Acidobacteriota bacterium]
MTPVLLDGINLQVRRGHRKMEVYLGENRISSRPNLFQWLPLDSILASFFSGAGLGQPRGMWGNDSHIWFGIDSSKIYAFDRITRARAPSRDISIAGVAGIAFSSVSGGQIWSDGTIMWIVGDNSTGSS